MSVADLGLPALAETNFHTHSERMMTASAREKDLTATLAVAADAMFVIALFAASRVLIWHSTAAQRWADLSCVAALAIGAVFPRERRMSMRGLAAIAMAIAEAVFLDRSYDIAWLLHLVLIAHLLLLIGIRQPILWNFSLVLACLLWIVS